MKLQDSTAFVRIKVSFCSAGKIYYMIVLFLLFFMFMPLTYSAGAASTKPGDGARTQKEELLCGNIKEKIINKEEIRKIVKISIQMGYNACGVIKCSIQEGGDLRQVITGAVEAGVTKDVVSRCALDAGAEAREVALILNSVSAPGLCYVIPEEPEIVVPPVPVYISPSGF